MRQKTGPQTSAAEKTIKDIRRATRKHHSSEEKIRIVLEGLRGEDSIAAICRREGIAESLYYSWSKEFLEAGKKRLAGDTARSATSDEVKALRRESRDLKEALADLTLYLDGHDLSKMELSSRRHLLAEMLHGRQGAIMLSEEFQGDGADLLQASCDHGLEGIVAKRLDMPYRSGAGGDWIKVKCVQRESSSSSATRGTDS